MMGGRRKVLSVLFGVLALTVTVEAGMVSVSAVEIEGRQSARVCSGVQAHPTDSFSPFANPSITDLTLEPIQVSAEAGIDLGQPSQTRPPQILTDGQSSFSLCLSAMIGLGLCSFAHRVGKPSFGFIPEWYHNGGPFQIGHSLAVLPNLLSPVPVRCFVQPVWTAEDSLGQYCRETVTSLWRKSQFTPCVLASRGPPCMS